MTYARDLILTLTAVALVYVADNWPKPVKPVETVPYCIIDFPTGRIHPLTGEWQKGWGRGYGPCTLLDRYEEI